MSLKAIATAAELPLSHVTALTSLGKGRRQRQDAEKFNRTYDVFVLYIKK